MKKFIFLILLCWIGALPFFAHTDSGKQRLIVTTDLEGADPDDKESLVHLFVCANRIDLEGIISSNAWVDDPDRTSEILKVIDGYAAAYPFLKVHSNGFPEVKYVQSSVRIFTEYP